MGSEKKGIERRRAEERWRKDDPPSVEAADDGQKSARGQRAIERQSSLRLGLLLERLCAAMRKTIAA